MENKTTKKLLTLCMVYQSPRLLLGMKKRGFGIGRWSGFGGKVQAGETIEEAAKRELKEEANIEAATLDKVGILEFEFKGNPEILETHVFCTDSFQGEVKESEEMRPQWWHINDIPFKEMWSDGIYWLPLLLEGKKFKGRFLFGEQDNVLEYDLKEIEEI